MLDQVALYQGTGFTRGIALTDEHLLLGESELKVDRDTRTQGRGRVVLLARASGKVLGSLSLPGQVHEIRCLHRPDLATSNGGADV